MWKWKNSSSRVGKRWANIVICNSLRANVTMRKKCGELMGSGIFSFNPFHSWLERRKKHQWEQVTITTMQYCHITCNHPLLFIARGTQHVLTMSSGTQTKIAHAIIGLNNALIRQGFDRLVLGGSPAIRHSLEWRLIPQRKSRWVEIRPRRPLNNQSIAP